MVAVRWPLRAGDHDGDRADSNVAGTLALVKVLPDSSQWLYGHFGEALRTGDALTVLDVGCGRGTHASSDPVARAAYEFGFSHHVMTGTDLDPVGSKHPWLHDFRLGDGMTIPYASDSVDVIIFDWVMEHVTEPDGFVAELARVLKPGGTVLFRTVQRWSPAGLGASLVPNRWHVSLIRRLQPGMHSADVYPTAMKANTIRVIDRLFRQHGMTVNVTRCAGLDWYVPVRSLRPAARFIERAMPGWFSHAIVAEARLPATGLTK
jgi:SAM-dependent methyltransferase